MPTTVHFENIKGILLDIEGTTSSISFVYDEMFPFVRRELNAFLEAEWNDPGVHAACERIVQDADGQCELTKECIAKEVIRLMDDDVKATGTEESPRADLEIGIRERRIGGPRIRRRRAGS